MNDAVLITGVVLAFAAVVTAHLALVAGLAMRPPRWRALVSLVVPPLAPYWGFRESMRWRAALWLATAVTYVVFRVLAAR